MRFPTPLLLLPLLVGQAPVPPVDSPTRVTADSIPVSVRWNRLVPILVDEAAASRRAARKAAAAAGDSATLRRIAMTPPPFLFRIYTLLSLAQYGAVNSARENRAAASEAAVASASATVLTEVFTDSTVRASIARELARDLEQSRTGSRATERATAGRGLGEDVARRVIAWAPSVNLIGPWNGTIPKGPGMWYSAPGVPPIGVAMATARTWLLDSAAQFRPAPPPAYGSPAWKAALEEVRRVARERTPEQTKIAQQWNAADPWALWNETATAAIRRHRMSEAEAARVLAVMNVGAMDAVTRMLRGEVPLLDYPTFAGRHDPRAC